MNIELYLEDLSNKDLACSRAGLESLYNKKITRFRYDSKRKEIYIEVEDGTRLFIDNVKNDFDISIT
jgi:hypothetical protein